MRRSDDRHRRRSDSGWLTFHPRRRVTPAESFGVLQSLRESRLPPRTDVSSRTHDAAEIITYVREGTLAYEDSRGIAGVIRAGEFQRMTCERGVRFSEANASPSTAAHFFQIWLRPSEATLDPGHEQKRFSAANRRGRLCVIASPDHDPESLHIHQDSVLYAATLDTGQHLVHELMAGRRAWLHVVDGELVLRDLVLTTGDGAGVTTERAVSITARRETEILLLDLAD